MNIPKLKNCVLGFILVGVAAWNSSAQMPGAGSPAGMSAAMVKLFGDIKAFTAKAEVQVLDGSQKQLALMPMDFALLDGSIRVEMDMTQVKNSSMPPGAAAQLKQLGMAQVISVVRPDKKTIYVIYPDQKIYLNMPMPKEDAEAAQKTPKIQKTALGKDTLDGHACVKNKTLISDDRGNSVEATTWNATDLKDFPVQIQTQENQATSLVRFKQIQFTKPELKQFEPPPGYAQYTNQWELQQAVMKKMMPDAGKK
jgi:hypothetical protein